MCYTRNFKPKPHFLQKFFPGLLSTQCVKAYGYIGSDSASALCEQCFFRFCPPLLVEGTFHGFAQGRVPKSLCTNCKKILCEYRPITQCDLCFTNYLSVITFLRKRNYYPNLITILRYDNYRQEITRLITFNPHTEEPIVLTPNHQHEILYI